MLDGPYKNYNDLGARVTVATSGPLKAFEGMCQLVRDPIMLVATETRAPYTRARIVSVNKACEDLINFTAGRLYNQSLHQLIADLEDPVNTTWQNYNFDLEEPWQGPLILRTRSSATIAVDASVSKLGHDHGENFFTLRFIKKDGNTAKSQNGNGNALGSPAPNTGLIFGDVPPVTIAPSQPSLPSVPQLPSLPPVSITPVTIPFEPFDPFASSPYPAAPAPEPTPAPAAMVDSFASLPTDAAEAPTSPPAQELDAESSQNEDYARLEAVLRYTPAGIFRVAVTSEKDFVYISANQKYEDMAGQTTDTIAGRRPEDIMPTGQAQNIRKYYVQCLETRKSTIFEEYMDLPIGKRWFQTTLVPLADESGDVVELVGVSFDVTDRKTTADALAGKIYQQAAIAELSQLALTQLDLKIMLGKAVEIIANALNVPFCKIQEYSSNEQMLILRAGIGWQDGLVGTHKSSIWDNTQAAAALKSLNPVVIENYDQDQRFAISPLLSEHQIKSGVAVVISGLNGPYGILSIHSAEPAIYDEDEVYFLQSAADTLASAIKNNLAEQALRESERLVSSILESTQIGIGVSDQSGRFVRVNQAFCKIFGYESKDLLGREFTILLPFAEHQRARQIYAQFMKTGAEMPGEGTCLRKDGRPVDVQITAGRLQRADGSMLRVTTVEDITQRKVIENSLKLFQLAALNSHDGIVITEPGPIDTPGPKIIFCNAAASTITGYAQNDILGATLKIFQGPETEDIRFRDIQSAMRQRKTADIEIILHRKDQTPYWAQVGVVPVTDQQGRHMNWLITFRDITERKENERLLEVAREQAVTASEAKSDFLAGISHEIRTPLNAIIGFADVLRREIFGPLGHERYRSYAEDIHDSGRHLLQLINNTLDLSKIEAGVLELHESEVPIDAVVRSSVALMRDSAQNGQLTISVELPEKPPVVRGDETKIKQILLNMLSNAIKYTLPGGKITVRAFVEPRGLALQVQDTGVGIPKAELPKVMQKYMQASNEQNKHTTGTGLGIPVTKSLIELHQGILDLSSEEGVGTTITAVFPNERLVDYQSRPFPSHKLAS
ncbi:MAG: PAS domain S-box protein [Alphaproteobacteria bacterium]|nr:MAG: PAS domain S-box protein [Alphaproteobacteria bacterium]